MLELSNISKIFPGNPSPAVDRVSLTIAEGEFFALLGPSGCGKTTLLRMLGGFETPTDGQILHERVRIDTLEPHERPFNMVFQRYALFPHLSVEKNIAFGLEMKRVIPTEIRSRVEEMLSLVKLEGYGPRPIGTLSGGQQQRVALARALVNRPKVLLLDEPLSALDLKLRQQMQVELRAIQRRLKHTFIFVTHDQEEALTLSDRIAVMNAGVVEQVGTPREIYERPATRFVAQFIGTVNQLDAEVGESAPGGELELKGWPKAPFKAKVDEAAEYPRGKRVSVLLRPEKLRLERPGTASNGFDAVVRDVVFHGATTLFYVQPEERKDALWVVSRANAATGAGLSTANEGDRVRVSWDSSDALVLAADGADRG